MENNYKPLTKEELEKAFSCCLEKIDEKLDEYDGKYPTYGINNKYRLVETGDDWVEGFWVGMLWLAYEMTNDEKYRVQAEKYIDTYYKVFNHFIENLPSDYVCGWDLIFTQDDCQRDSSAAATAVCGMKEMLKYSKRDEEKINMAINNILRSLIENYTTKNTDNDGLLMHGVYSLPIDLAVDECVIWGDYFYMEALVRMLKDWELYW